MNRKRHTAARSSARRIATATALAAAALAAAAGWTAAAAASAKWTDKSIAEVCHWIRTGNGPLTVSALHGSPDNLETHAWTLWRKRLAASARR